MIQWFRDLLAARRERKVFEALWMLAEMEHAQTEAGCDWCDGDLSRCICDGPDCD